MIGILSVDIFILIPIGLVVLLSAVFMLMRNMLLLMLRRSDTDQ